jgi:hypothetical protein
MKAFSAPQLSPLICHSSSVIVCEGNVASKIRLQDFFRQGKDADHIKLLNEFVLSLIQISSSGHAHQLTLYNKSHFIAGKNPDGTPDLDTVFCVRIQHLESSPA